METTTKATEKVQASKGNKEATRLAAKAMPRPRHQQGGASLTQLDLLSPYTAMANSEPSLWEDGQGVSRHHGRSRSQVAQRGDKAENATMEEDRTFFSLLGAMFQKGRESHAGRLFLCAKEKAIIFMGF